MQAAHPVVRATIDCQANGIYGYKLVQARIAVAPLLQLQSRGGGYSPCQGIAHWAKPRGRPSAACQGHSDCLIVLQSFRLLVGFSRPQTGNLSTSPHTELTAVGRPTPESYLGSIRYALRRTNTQAVFGLAGSCCQLIAACSLTPDRWQL